MCVSTRRGLYCRDDFLYTHDNVTLHNVVSIIASCNFNVAALVAAHGLLAIVLLLLLLLVFFVRMFPMS